MADRIIQDRYIFDLNGDDAVREILRIVDALEKQQDAAADAVDATNKLGKSNTELADAEKKLAAILAQEAKTVDGLVNKLDALRKVEKTLSDEQKNRIGISKQILKTETDLSNKIQETAKSQRGLNDTLKTGSARLLAFIKAGAGLAGIAGGFAFALDRAAQLDAQIDSVQKSIQGLTREGAVALTGDIIGTAATFDIDTNELLDAVKTASNEFSEDAFTVLEEINTGLIRSTTQRAREEIVEQIKEYSTQLASAGLSLRESVEIINLGDSLGIFSDKAAAAVKDVGIRLGEQTKATTDAVINAFGKDFAKQLFDDLDAGLPTFEAFKRISEELGNVDINQQQYAQLVADLGGGALEDAGRRFFEAIKDVGEGTGDLVEGLTEYQAAQADLLNTNREIGRTQTQIADELTDLSREYTNGTASIRLYLTRGVLVLVETLKQLPGFIRENKAEIAALFAAAAIANVGRFVSAIKTLNDAIRAQIVLNNALKLSNPYTAAIAGVTALVAGISILTKERSAEARITEQVNSLTKSLTSEYVKERQELDSLFKPLQDANVKGEERARIIDEIQNRYGDYLDNINLETATAEELANAYDRVNQAIINNLVAKAVKERADALTAELVQLQTELATIDEQSVTIGDRAKAALISLGGIGAVSAQSVRRSGVQDAIADIEKEFSALGASSEELKRILAGLDLSFLQTPAAQLENVNKRTQASTKQLKQSADGTKEAALSLEEQLRRLGVTVDQSYTKSIEGAGTQSEALTVLLDQLESSLSKIETQAKENVTVDTLPQLENVLSLIQAEREQIDNARELLARQTLQVEPLETLDPGEVISGAEPPTVKVDLAPPTDEQIKITFEEIIKGFEEISSAAFDLASAFVDPQLEALNTLVDEQKNTLAELESNSEDYNARQIARERERLDALEREQAAAAERARNIARLEVAAQIALAIAKAATTPFPANIPAIISTLAAITSAIGQASTIAGAFAEGTDYLERPTGTPAGRDTILIRADEGEMIHSAKDNKRLRAAGITDRKEVVRRAIANKLFDTSGMQNMQHDAHINANTNMAARMAQAGISINNTINTDAANETNRLLGILVERETRYKPAPPQMPNKVKRNK